MTAAAAAAGAAAAAAIAEMQRREEEEMTHHSPQDLAEGWEFKILRAHTGIFGKPERLRAVLDEERRGGWVLVEKFDNNRIRLKRPADAKVAQGDFDGPYDPYRTTVGMAEWKMAVVSVGAAILIVGVFIALMSVMKGQGGRGERPEPGLQPGRLRARTPDSHARSGPPAT